MTSPSTTNDKPRLPASATHYGINLVGVAAALIALFIFHEQKLSDSRIILAVCAAGTLPIIALEMLVLRVHRRESTGIDWDREPTPNVGRVATKLIGLAIPVGLLALAYFVFPEYGDWYGAFWSVLRRYGALLVVIAVIYIWFVDGRARDPHDAYWQLGRVVLGHPSDARPGEIPNHLRGWLIKGFFIPLFVVFTHNQLSGIIRYDLSNVHVTDMRLFHFSTDLVYAIDVLYATMGYCLSFRLFDAHLRSAEPTMLGWVVALECYMPFWGRLSSPLYLHYDGIGFETWLSDHLGIRWVWAVVVLALEVIYLLATFAFGVRFSNLTHRGILTNGPYRYTKHPAYIAKNMSWWLITLPFITYQAHGWVDAIKSTLALGGVSAVYFMRARTEERHLSRDPIYVEYAKWMNEHGALRFLNRIPFFKYRPPAAPVTAPVVAPSAEPASSHS
jgi:protein-S-isoprenylcysteine O-methyltransferase Ste14